MDTITCDKNISRDNRDEFELSKNTKSFFDCVNYTIGLFDDQDLKFNRARMFYNLYRFLEVNECYWNNRTNLKQNIGKKLDEAVNNKHCKENIDFYLNLQCKYGWKNYCIATTAKNRRCKKGKKHGQYCTHHHKRNNTLLQKLTRNIIPEISTLIIGYL